MIMLDFAVQRIFLFNYGKIMTIATADALENVRHYRYV